MTLKLYFRISLFFCGMVVGAFYHDIRRYDTGLDAQAVRAATLSPGFPSFPPFSGDTLTVQDRNF